MTTLIEFAYRNEIIKIAAHSDDYITNKINEDNVCFYESDVLEYIKSRFTGGVALDVGANIGNHSIYFSKFVFEKIFAFEPNSKNFLLLLENKRINNIDDKLTIYNSALSDGHYNYVSLDYVSNMGKSCIVEGNGDLITKRLDDFDFPKVDFIKIDVEGHELKVLKGAEDLINRDLPVIAVECIDDTASDIRLVNPYMLQLNYKLTNIIDMMFFYEYCC